MNHPHSSEQLDRWIRIILAVLVVALLVLCGLLLHEYSQLRRDDILNSRAQWLAAVSKHKPGSMTDVNFIQPWMTFNYISMVYGVSTTALSSSLDISDPRYPRVSITEYAEDHQLSVNAFLASVKSTIGEYLAQKGS